MATLGRGQAVSRDALKIRRLRKRPPELVDLPEFLAAQDAGTVTSVNPWHSTSRRLDDNEVDLDGVALELSQRSNCLLVGHEGKVAQRPDCLTDGERS